MNNRRSDPSAGEGGGGDERAEQVLSQALRVMAGGEKVSAPSQGQGRTGTRRITTSQLMLLAAIVGLLIGIGSGFISLMF